MIFQAFDPLDLQHAKYFQDMPCNLTGDTKGIVAVTNKGEPKGMIALDNWTTHSVFGHIKITSPMCLREGGLVAETTDYVYNVVGLGIIYAPISSDNESAINIVTKIGFEKEAVLKGAYGPGVHNLIFSMRPHQCKFNKQRRAA